MTEGAAAADATHASGAAGATSPAGVRTEPATGSSPTLAGRSPRVLVLADDLIWATRLDGIVRAAGASPTVVADPDAFADALGAVDGVLVDLSSRRGDPVAAIERARSAGRPVVAVGPHQDHDARRRAMAAGASRVFAYSKLFDDGPRTVAAWLLRSTTPEVPER